GGPGEALAFIASVSAACDARFASGIAPRLFSTVAGVVTSSVHEKGIVVRFFSVNAGPEIIPPTFKEWSVGSIVMVGSQASAVASLFAYCTANGLEQGTAPPPEDSTLSTVQIVFPSASLRTYL